MSFVIKNARLSYPALFNPKDYKGDKNFKWQAHFLIPKNDPQVAELEAVMLQQAKAKWGSKAQTIFDNLKSDNKICLLDGKRKPDEEAYQGMMFVSANHAKKKPDVRRRDKSRATEDDEGTLFYPGAVVLGVLEIYCQDNNYGKRINASLLGVQFMAHADRFAGGLSVAKDEDFEDLGDGADADDFI
ncbi:MAG: hypothetical protein RL661_888 [Pseudomonadota bacterium]|jgi:hypothetical protein